MNTSTKTKRTILIGGMQYRLPLNQNGYYVSDANGHTILEAGSIEIAKEMLKLLNSQVKEI